MSRAARVLSGSGVAVGLLLVAVVAPAAPDASPALWPDVVREVSGVLERAAKAYEANDPKGAQELVGEAYFGACEERRMEAAVRRDISARRARDLEKMFGEIRRAIGTGEPAPGVRRRITTLREALDGGARGVVRGGGGGDTAGREGGGWGARAGGGPARGRREGPDDADRRAPRRGEGASPGRRPGGGPRAPPRPRQPFPC